MDRIVHAWLVPAHRSRAGARQALAAAGARLLDIDPAQVTVGREAGGRPTVETVAGRAWVSLSYGPGLLAVAASLAGPVGVDVEGETRPEVARLAERWFDPAEAAWLRDRPAAGRTRDFLLLWTAKEALGKALGSGLRDRGLRRRVPLPPVTGDSFRPVADGLWLAHPAPRGSQVLAVAAAVPVSGLVVHDTALHDTALHDTALHDTALHDTASPGLVLPVPAQDEGTGHVAPALSTARSRESLPVVVRGN